MLAKVARDMSRSLDGDLFSLQRVASCQLVKAGLDPVVDPDRGYRGWIASASEGAVDSRHVLRFHPHQFHVLHASTDILGGDVPPAQALDEAAVGPEERLGLVLVGITDNYRLASAEVQAGDGGLVRHTARETEGIDQGILI